MNNIATLLMLEDGRLFREKSFGAEGEITKEVCFNKRMTGYQEILTRSSYWGQIVSMIYHHIGTTVSTEMMLNQVKFRLTDL